MKKFFGFIFEKMFVVASIIAAAWIIENNMNGIIGEVYLAGYWKAAGLLGVNIFNLVEYSRMYHIVVVLMIGAVISIVPCSVIGFIVNRD